MTDNTSMLERMARAIANTARARADLGPTPHTPDPNGFAMLAARLPGSRIPEYLAWAFWTVAALLWAIPQLG